MKLSSPERLLLSSNILTIILAILLGYNFAMIVWIYWFESVAIGVFTFIGLLIARTWGGIIPRFMQIILAFFFALHYGGFHLGYLIALSSFPWFAIDTMGLLWVLLSGSILFTSHAYSFYENVWKKRKEPGEDRKFDQLQFGDPYYRILPLHLTIIGSAFVVIIFEIESSLPLLLIFMGLKTYSDWQFHRRQHRLK